MDVFQITYNNMHLKISISIQTENLILLPARLWDIFSQNKVQRSSRLNCLDISVRATLLECSASFGLFCFNEPTQCETQKSELFNLCSQVRYNRFHNICSFNSVDLMRLTHKHLNKKLTNAFEILLILCHIVEILVLSKYNCKRCNPKPCCDISKQIKLKNCLNIPLIHTFIIGSPTSPAPRRWACQPCIARAAASLLALPGPDPDP